MGMVDYIALNTST